MALVRENGYNYSETSAQSIQLGDTVTGSLSSSTSADWYKLTITDPTVVNLNLDAGHYSTWTFGTEILNQNNAIMGSDSLGYSNPLNFSSYLATAGTYYIQVFPDSNYSSDQYALSVSATPLSSVVYEQENNNTPATANPIRLGQIVSGQMASSDDVDNYAIQLTADGSLGITFKSPDLYQGDTFNIDLLDASGKIVAESSQASAIDVFYSSPLAPGRYTLQVQHPAGYEGSNYNFEVNQYPVTGIKSTSLPINQTLNDSINTVGQSKFYSVNLVAGQCYEFSALGAQSGSGTLATPRLTLLDQDFHALENASSTPTWTGTGTSYTGDPAIGFIAPYTGTYNISVSGDFNIGSYQLSDVSIDKTSFLSDLINKTSTDNFFHFGSDIASTTTPITITYSFETTNGDNDSGFVPMTAAQQTIVRNALAEYAKVLNVNFVEVNDSPSVNIRYGTSSQVGSEGFAAFSASPDGTMTSNFVLMNNIPDADGKVWSDKAAPGGYGLEAILHETGHALGLKHPGDYDVNGTGTPPFIAAGFADRLFSIMSYLDNPNYPDYYSSTPAVLDILALQSLYGARVTTDNSQTVFDGSTPLLQTALNSGSGQILDFSKEKDNCIISLTPGTFSSVGINADGTSAHDNLAIPFGANINQVMTGSGNNTVFCNDQNDIVLCGTGNNVIYSGGGSDTVTGGNGMNSLVISGASTNYITKAVNGGFQVQSLTGGQIDTLSNVERVQFSDKVDVAFDLNDSASAGGIYRIYQAAFDRKPDLSGLGYWIYKADNGESALNIATEFTYSQEFQQVYNVHTIDGYGTGENVSTVVTEFYQHVLHRSPDSGGLTFYTNAIVTHQKTEGQVLAEIADERVRFFV